MAPKQALDLQVELSGTGWGALKGMPADMLEMLHFGRLHVDGKLRMMVG